MPNRRVQDAKSERPRCYIGESKMLYRRARFDFGALLLETTKT